MQAVTVEHLYGRPLLPSFYGFWTAGGLVATILTLALGDTPIGPSLLPLLLVPLATLAAPFASKDRVPAPDAAADIPWRRIVLLGVAMVLFYMVDTAAETWGPTYLHGTLDAPTSQAALATLPYLLATLLARGVGDQLVDRLGAVVVLRLGAVVAAVALALIVLAPTWPVAVAGFAVLGGAVATIAPLSFSAAGAIAGGGDFASQQDRVDQVIARLNQFNYAGALLGSVLTGVVGAGDLRLGFAVPMVLVLGIIPLSSQFAVVRRSTLRMGRPPGRG
jgi:MFS family permease